MNLRRWITALAVLAVFTALASAQITPASQVTCTVTAPGTVPSIRSEGLAERVGDLRLICTGGLPFAAGSAADRATITVDYGVAITSRGDSTTAANVEAALVIDEPGSLSAAGASALGITGYGPNAGLSPCAVSAQPCSAFAQVAGGYIVADAAAVKSSTTAANAYQGVVSKGVVAGSQVTFSNVPLIPPATAGVQRVYRVVNVRVTPGGVGTINATLTSSLATGAASSLVAAGSAQVATSAVSLTTSVAVSPVSACVSTSLTPSTATATSPGNVALLKFNQAFSGAFKTRIVAQNTAADLGTGTGGNGVAGMAGTATSPGAAEGNFTYTNAKASASSVTNNSESGVLLNFGAGLATAGIADTGTRLKAVFAGLDLNATYYVSVYNVADFNDEVTAPTSAIGDGTAIPYAVQQTGAENAAYAAAPTGNVANLGVVGGTGVNTAVLNVGTSGTGKGAATVIWEITNMKASNNDTYMFAVYAKYTVPKVPATTNAATVALSYAPTNGSASTTPVGSTTTNIPRYSTLGTATSTFSALPCQTTLLFPFVTNQSATATTHWETGVAIQNTGSDPLGTIGTSGTCTLNFYGTNAGSTPPPTITTAAIAPGAGYLFVVSNPANASPAPTYASFTGYLFAVCNFNYAHGFAFVEDDTRSMAMGYLGLVLNAQSTQVQRGSFTLGETLAQ